MGALTLFIIELALIALAAVIYNTYNASTVAAFEPAHLIKLPVERLVTTPSKPLENGKISSKIMLFIDTVSVSCAESQLLVRQLQSNVKPWQSLHFYYRNQKQLGNNSTTPGTQVTECLYHNTIATTAQPQTHKQTQAYYTTHEMISLAYGASTHGNNERDQLPDLTFIMVGNFDNTSTLDSLGHKSTSSEADIDLKWQSMLLNVCYC